MKTLLFRLLIAFLFVSNTVFAQKNTMRFLLIPLDDRPPCLQFPVKMGLIGDAEIVVPPRPLLGRFTDFGKSDALIDWLKQQSLTQFDAAIVSLDMLAYGGLVASRVHETALKVAQKRVEILQNLREKAPNLKIYASSTLMRLAPTADAKNEAYRTALARWADLSPYKEHENEVAELKKKIPADALANYKNARQRNLQINLMAINYVQKNTINYLIIAQDDAKPKGIHISDREFLTKTVETANLSQKIALQSGTDEVAMLLLARAMAEKNNYHPKIKPIFSSEMMAQQTMPYEDSPLSKTVSFHIKAVGATEVSDAADADILFYVFTSRFEPNRAERFADEMLKTVSKPMILADIDPKGDVQGGDTIFTEGVLRRGIFPKLYGYACWNTAGNTIGTALPHGIMYGISEKMRTAKVAKKVANRMAKAHNWFTLNRLLDDYTYHSLVRPALQTKIRTEKWNAFKLTDAQTQMIEAIGLADLERRAWVLSQKLNFTEGSKKYKFSKLNFDLPWNRTFEAEIDFELKH